MNDGVISASHDARAQESAAAPRPTIHPILRLRNGRLTRTNCTDSRCIDCVTPSFSTSTIDVSLNELKCPFTVTDSDAPASWKRTLIRTPSGIVSIRLQSDRASCCTSSLDTAETAARVSATTNPTKRIIYCGTCHCDETELDPPGEGPRPSLARSGGSPPPPIPAAVLHGSAIGSFGDGRVARKQPAVRHGPGSVDHSTCSAGCAHSLSSTSSPVRSPEPTRACVSLASRTLTAWSR